MVETKDMYEIEFTDKEYEDFLKAFDYYNMGNFEILFYFAQFDPDMKEHVEELKKAEKRIEQKYQWKFRKKDIDKVASRLKKKEAQLFFRLADSAEMCASSDQRFTSYVENIGYYRMVAEFELEKRMDRNAQKRLIKKNK